MPAKETEELEGTGASLFVQLIRKFGYNKDINIELATVTADPPNLKIKIDNMPEELEKDDLIVAEHLTKHKRRIKLTLPKFTLTAFETSSLNVDYSSSVSIDFNGLTMTGTGKGTTPDNTESEFAEIEFTDELKKGDRIIVAEIMEGQMYIILDRAVTY